MAQRRLTELTLNHEHKAGGAGLHGLVAAERQAELVFLV
jgi:hypothetical protein